MKAQVLFLAIGVLFFLNTKSVTAQTQQKQVEIIVKTFYETGELKTETKFINGKPHGKHFSFHKNGNIKDIGMFNSGLESGIWESFTEEGLLYAQGEFENGKKHGVWKIWDIKGVLRFEKIYQNEILESWIERDSNGMVISKN